MRKVLTLCLVVGFSLSLVGCTTNNQGTNSNGSSSSSSASNNNASSSSDLIPASECLPNCELLGDLKDTCVAGCWLNEAERLLDADICMDKVDDSLLQTGCVMNVSVAAEDPDACALLGDGADLCYSSYADETGDESVCDKITDEFMHSVCLDNFTEE